MNKVLLTALAFTLLLVSCSAPQNDQPLDGNQNGQDPSNRNPPAVEDTVPGPNVLNLDDNSLYQYRDKNFTTSMRMDYEGSGGGGFVAIEGAWIANSPPEWNFTFDTSLPLWQGVVPFTYTSAGGQLYGNTPVSGCYIETEDMENPYDDYFIDENYLTGEVSLIESGVIINGAVTDRYEVTHENQIDQEESAFYDYIFTDTTGSVYVDRITNVIVRFTQSGTGLDRSNNPAGDEVDIDFQLDFSIANIPNQISIPSNCGEAAAEDGVDFGDAGDIPFPVMEDAYNISAVFGLYSYETNFSTAEVLEFYRQELSDLGWSLSGNPDSSSSSFYLDFQKDGESLQILVSQGEQPGTSFILITHFQ